MSSPAAVPASPREPEALALDRRLTMLPAFMAAHVETLRERPDGSRQGKVVAVVEVNPHGSIVKVFVRPPAQVVR